MKISFFGWELSRRSSWVESCNQNIFTGSCLYRSFTALVEKISITVAWLFGYPQLKIFRCHNCEIFMLRSRQVQHKTPGHINLEVSFTIKYHTLMFYYQSYNIILQFVKISMTHIKVDRVIKQTVMLRC